MAPVISEHVCRRRRWYRRRYAGARTGHAKRIAAVVIHRYHRRSVSATKRKRRLIVELLLLLKHLVLEVLVLWSLFSRCGQIQLHERSEPSFGEICNGSEPSRIVLDAIPGPVTDSATLHGITRTTVLGQRLPPVKLAMVRVETTCLRKTSVTAGTSASFTCPGHATTSTGTIIFPAAAAAAFGATERVEEAGLLLGTAVAAGQLLVLVRRDIARLGGHKLRIAAGS